MSLLNMYVLPIIMTSFARRDAPFLSKSNSFNIHCALNLPEYMELNCMGYGNLPFQPM